MRVGVFLQAQLNSPPLEHKALLPLAGVPALKHSMDALSLIPATHYAIITDSYSQAALEPLTVDTTWSIFVGDGDDILKRYVQATRHFEVDYIIRATMDSPAVSYDLVRGLMLRAQSSKDPIPYVTYRNTIKGISSELVSSGALLYADRMAKRYSDRKEVTAYIRDTASEALMLDVSSQYAIGCCSLEFHTPEDYEKLQELFNTCYRGKPLTLDQISAWCRIYYVSRLQSGGCA